MPTRTQTDHITAAIHAALSKGATVDRDTLSNFEGETVDIDATVRVRGQLRVGRSTMTTQTNKLCPWKLALAALNRLNGASIAAVVREATELDEASTRPLKAQVAEVAGELLGTVRQRRAAPLRFAGAVEVQTEGAI